ncbi:MAG: endopeptidase La [Veillonella sp.]|jgi:ATP-dependent Lon protease|uniref:endopeptidase La n=1 Tax=Veillonella sp. TaxID=1926307 RepID=UPI001B409807|nr:endopeptidase La [Veillonella sp.]MBP6922735.1 endopeptidase La [Veillonella sp.]MBP9516869.1 endopeptidase La [Veillonella sp.]MBP9551191.1 endopeptidase La [Veillonella sp.]
MNLLEVGIPTVPLRGMVVYPNIVIHLDIGRDKSIKAVEKAMENDRILAVVTQKDDAVEDPTVHDLAVMGTLVKIKQMLRLPGGIVRILVEGITRIRVMNITSMDPFYVGDFDRVGSVYDDDVELEAYRRLVQAKFTNWAEEAKSITEEGISRVMELRDPCELADQVAFLLPIDNSKRQELLEELNVARRLNMIVGILNMELQISDLENSINNQVRQSMEKAQKEYFLREKIRVIHDELGDKGDPEEEAEELRKQLKNLELSEEIHERIDKEISRYSRMPSMMPEATILRNYLDWVLNLPWNEFSDDRLDIKEAREMLDADHYGLDKVKKRILEFLAVRKLTDKQSGSILCLVGPPGVGKTSLATSIAKAMNRKFVRASLGGVRDEAEIRGHRRTYIGALPGRMIQGIKNAGTRNPVFLLDEIDKLASDYKGDPSSALLEVLDPEQNNTFSDHFIEIPFDFSDVFWITTANVASNIPGPLLDRMEIIELTSYMEDEKLEIAKRYLAPKQIIRNGLEDHKVKLSDAVLKKIVSEYTREAGVRRLEKTIAKVCRKMAYQIVEEDGTSPKVSVKNLHEYLGAPIYIEEEREKRPQVGLVCGLAWTSVGGVVLPCEATTMAGTGKLSLTGSLGKVMQESGHAAMSYIRHNAKALKVDEEFYKKFDIHVHLPEGATPKDGPSAGITMTLAIVSALTNRKVRSDIAMTGEITLRGRVLPIGGLKEKLLAALSYGVKEVLIPKGNVKDIDELPDSVKEGLIITPVKTMDEVLAKALV